MRLRHARWLLILPAGMLAGYGLSTIVTGKSETHYDSPHAIQEQPAKPRPATRKHAQIDSPTRLDIPSLKISAPILPVGVTRSNDMDVPNSATAVGWYKFGAVPGRPGNAVLAGHLGIKSDQAVFWTLDKLKIGDTLSVSDAKHQSINFQVIDKAYYAPQAAPRERIFGASTSANLNLITCNGSYIENKDDYTKRLVVFTRAL